MGDLQGSDIYRINDLIKTVEIRQPLTILKFASSSFPLFPSGPDSKGRHRTRGERLRGGTLSLVGWSDAAYNDFSQNVKCRLGYLIDIMSSPLTGPRRVLHWASKFTSNFVRSSLGGEVYAASETIGHMALLREFYVLFSGVSPGMVGMEDC